MRCSFALLLDHLCRHATDDTPVVQTPVELFHGLVVCTLHEELGRLAVDLQPLFLVLDVGPGAPGGELDIDVAREGGADTCAKDGSQSELPWNGCVEVFLDVHVFSKYRW